MDNSTTTASSGMALVIPTAMLATGCVAHHLNVGLLWRRGWAVLEGMLLIAVRAFVRQCLDGRTLLMSVGLAVLAIPAWSQIRITDGNIPFFYESRADVRAPDHQLAAIISTDYRNADDEFTRHDLFQQLKPVIESRLSQAEQDTQVYLLIGDNLGNYAFDRSAFPTDMRSRPASSTSPPCSRLCRSCPRS